MIHLSREQRDAIRRHGEADYPHECCGLIIGTFSDGGPKRVREVMALSNASDAGVRHNRFVIAPEDMLRGERHARGSGLDVIGFYHSHPDHPPRPSAFDLEHAWPVYSYVIVSVLQGRAGDLSSWELRHDRSAFDSEELIEVP